MKRLVFIAQGLCGGTDGDSGLRMAPKPFKDWAAEGTVVGIAPVQGRLPELLALGVDPDSIDIPEGPIMVAALGHDPPERSVHFCLTLGSVSESGVLEQPSDTSGADVAEALRFGETLSTKSLRVLQGRGRDHALVWLEGSVELGTTPWYKAVGRPYRPAMPEGDGEGALRRLIDDSVNLLAEQDFNKRRRDEGQSPLNVLWPWGQGFRPQTPHLALKRGRAVLILSGSLRMKGLAKLFGYSSLDEGFSKPLWPDYDSVPPLTGRYDDIVVLSDNFAVAREHGRIEDMERMLVEAFSQLLEPFTQRRPARVSLLATSAVGPGLALLWDSERPRSEAMPFDERALEDRRLGVRPAWELVKELVEA
ncbi:MAG: hypothetical protein JSS66_01190 [Armatimonadetes bacterium]|nr:hypothetical protein [Armatimonadota bacterium]